MTLFVVASSIWLFLQRIRQVVILMMIKVLWYRSSSWSSKYDRDDCLLKNHPDALRDDVEIDHIIQCNIQHCRVILIRPLLDSLARAPLKTLATSTLIHAHSLRHQFVTHSNRHDSRVSLHTVVQRCIPAEDFCKQPFAPLSCAFSSRNAAIGYLTPCQHPPFSSWVPLIVRILSSSVVRRN